MSSSNCPFHNNCCQDCGYRNCIQDCGSRNYDPIEKCTCDSQIAVYNYNYGTIVKNTFNQTDFIQHIRTHTIDHPEIGRIHHLPMYSLDAPINTEEFDYLNGGWFMSTNLDELLSYSAFTLEYGIVYDNNFYGTLYCFNTDDISGAADKCIPMLQCIRNLSRRNALESILYNDDDEDDDDEDEDDDDDDDDDDEENDDEDD